ADLHFSNVPVTPTQHWLLVDEAQPIAESSYSLFVGFMDGQSCRFDEDLRSAVPKLEQWDLAFRSKSHDQGDTSADREKLREERRPAMTKEIDRRTPNKDETATPRLGEELADHAECDGSCVDEVCLPRPLPLQSAHH